VKNHEHQIVLCHHRPAFPETHMRRTPQLNPRGQQQGIKNPADDRIQRANIIDTQYPVFYILFARIDGNLLPKRNHLKLT
jgi:hypothetical protein